MLIRKTNLNDVDAVVEIYRHARKFMRETGNPNQWNKVYPAEEDVLSDIARGGGYVCEESGEIVAAFFFLKGEDKTYKKIYDGAWKNDEPYAVIHRIAVKYNGRGIAKFCFDECFKMHGNLRIDTHRDNIPMQTALKKSGFEYCGIIYLENGDERIAFQKCAEHL